MARWLNPLTAAPGMESAEQRSAGTAQRPRRTGPGTSFTAPGRNRPLASADRPQGQATGRFRTECNPYDWTDQFKALFSLAVRITETAGVDAILLLLDGTADWQRLRNMAGSAKVKILAAADTADQLGRGQRGRTGDRSASTCPIAPSTSGSPRPCWRPWPTTCWPPAPRWWPSIAASIPKRSIR